MFHATNSTISFQQGVLQHPHHPWPGAGRWLTGFGGWRTVYSQKKTSKLRLRRVAAELSVQAGALTSFSGLFLISFLLGGAGRGRETHRHVCLVPPLSHPNGLSSIVYPISQQRSIRSLRDCEGQRRRFSCRFPDFRHRNHQRSFEQHPIWLLWRSSVCSRAAATQVWLTYCWTSSGTGCVGKAANLMKLWQF